jgi:CheY-like chemotaxis protein
MRQQEPYRLSRHPPDLILVDLSLPVVPGEDVVREVRRYPPWIDVPVVVLTSSADPDELSRCLALGATECVTKPATFDGYVDIAMRLQRHIDATRSKRSRDAADRPGD